MRRITIIISICIIIYISIVIYLEKFRLIKYLIPPYSSKSLQKQFPEHVKLRGFAGADFQEDGKYGSNIKIKGTYNNLPGAYTDWSWIYSNKNINPPPWATTKLCRQYNKGNYNYKHWRTDVSRLHNIGANCYRFSLSWAKLQPNGPFTALDKRELNRILTKIKLLAEYKIICMITLLHFVTPIWFVGWLNRSLGLKQFKDFVRRVAQSLPCIADTNNNEWWITINEPSIAVVHGYVAGTRPPGIKNISKAIFAYITMLEAHIVASVLLRKIRNNKYKITVHSSPACNIMLMECDCRWSLIQQAFTYFIDYIFHKALIDLLVKGQAQIGNISIKGENTNNIPQPVFIAVNHYGRGIVEIRSRQLFVNHEKTGPNLIPNDLNWDINLDYLYSVLESLYCLAPNSRIVISEHGIPDQLDKNRLEFLKKTCTILHKCPYVYGYIFWSFTDNVEWEAGNKVRFGVIEVDYTKKGRRMPRESYYLLQNMWKYTESMSK